MKTCKTCLEEKDLSLFPKSKYGTRTQCKLCFNANQKAWRESHKEQVQRSWRSASNKAYSKDKKYLRRLKSYGLSSEDYDKIIDDQGGKCIICNEVKKLVIDHCHVSGKFRGLICNYCNLMLGYAEDKIDTLREAIKYLESTGL